MKQIIVTLFFVGSCLYSFGQVQFAVGIKGGPNFANINTEESAGANYKNRTGFHLGAFAQIKGRKNRLSAGTSFLTARVNYKI